NPTARTCPRTRALPPRPGVLAPATDPRADPPGQTQASRLRKPPARSPPLARMRQAPPAPERRLAAFGRVVLRRAGKSGRQRLIGRRGGAGGVRSVEAVVLLVAVATVVAAFAKRLRVPAPSLLVAAGVAAGMLPGAPVVHVPPAVVSLVVLPPLLYAASEELPWRDLRAVRRPGVVLAGGLGRASRGAGAAGGGGGASPLAGLAVFPGAPPGRTP